MAFFCTHFVLFLQHSSQTFEQRVLRLTESAAQRDQHNRQLSERVALLELELKQTVETRDRATRELEQAKVSSES